MVYVLIKHTVEDFSKWKPGFDAHASVRKESGCKGGMLFRTSEDPNGVVVIFEWDTIENARKFIESPELKKKMEEVGVISKPDIFFLDKLEDIAF
ncbi:antibiotic biosynthesis monooxygenase [Methanolobus sp. ZRKC3]|uniref:putative quinol monooxygenase n=1 Tax=Methanolobus sp. ZRKC3 TaxID=3125786 RepID=UPI0032512269